MSGSFSPNMRIVGLPDAAVQESRERVQAAIKNAGLPSPRKRILVNLVPATVRREGLAYDLSIALGVLLMSGMIPAESTVGTLVVGELSLDGPERHARVFLPIVALACKQDLEVPGWGRCEIQHPDLAARVMLPAIIIRLEGAAFAAGIPPNGVSSSYPASTILQSGCKERV